MRDDLKAIYAAAVAAVDPVRLVHEHVVRRRDAVVIRLGPGRQIVRPIDRLWVAGAGKAAVAMAAAIAELAPEVDGVVVAPQGRGRGTPGCGRIKVLRGDHPVPGRSSFAATASLLGALAAAPRDATVLFLLSGGASALLAMPADGLTRGDKSALTRHLLRCGAPIAVMNAVRKHVSAVKGGRLALRAAPREVVTLALSDVPGDDLATIGSGPAVADPTTFTMALRLLRASDPSGNGVPARVWSLLERGVAGAGPAESPKPGDRRLRGAAAAVIGNNRTALLAAVHAARARGYRVASRSFRLHGEAARCGRDLAATLPIEPRRPTCVLAGGETSVAAGPEAGKGGRCQELALAAAAGIAGRGWTLLCAGTDGIDGQTDAAGAFCDGATLRRAGRLAVARALAAHDSFPFFAALGDLFVPGPTGTNVMDVAIALHPGHADRAALHE